MKSGTYVPNLDVEVTAWPFPDQYGDGDVVTDDNGSPVTDKGGNVIKSYEAPEGFSDLHDDGNFVKVNKRGEPVRDQDGNAITIREGGAIAVFADGTVKTVHPDDMASFSRSMRLKEESSSPNIPEQPASPPEQPSSDTPDPSGSSGSADSGTPAPTSDNQAPTSDDNSTPDQQQGA